MPDLTTSITDLAWILQALLVLLATVAANALQKPLLRHLRVGVRHTNHLWDDAAGEALGPPLRLLIWVVGIAFALSIVKQAHAAPIFAAVEPLRDVGVVAALGWFLVRFIDQVERGAAARRSASGQPDLDHPTKIALVRIARISVIVAATLVMLSTLGFSISGILAFGGIGGIAIGFAAKDLLANFFGGLMIYLDRPFAIGDWIRSPDREIEGTVERVGWRLTRIRTFDKRPLYVPNSVFTSSVVENPSRMSNRRIKESIGLRYEDADKLPAIIEEIKAMLHAHPEIDTDQTLMVNLDQFGPSSLDFFIYAFTKTTKWSEFHRIKQEVLLAILEIIARHEAEIAYPTRTLYHYEADPDEPPTS